MLKPRYYYSDDYSLIPFEAICVNGNPIQSFKSGPAKKLPRLTICGIWDTDTNQMRFGYAKCSPKDIFNRKLGRKIAYGRAIENPILVVEIGDSKVPEVFINNARLVDEHIMLNKELN